MVVIELGAGLILGAGTLALFVPKRRPTCFRTIGLAAFISLLAWLGLPPTAPKASRPSVMQLVKR